MMKRFLGVLLVVALAFLAFFAFSPISAASATEAPAFQKYETSQTWYAPSPASTTHPFAVPQTTKVLECGGIKQFDQYTIDSAELEAQYKALIAGGVLTGPDKDAPFHPRGVVTALPDCAPVVVIEPRIQDFVKCEGAAFVLDNIASTETVTYVVNGISFVVPAGTAVHTDSNGTLIQPVNGQYIVTAGDQSWTFPTKADCVVVPPVVDVPPVVVPPVVDVPVNETPVVTTPDVPVITPVADVPVTLTPVVDEAPAAVLTAKATDNKVAVAPTTDALAFTGTNENLQISMLVAAGLAILAGIGLLIARAVRGPAKTGIVRG
jgi:hypothetical protein